MSTTSLWSADAAPQYFAAPPIDSVSIQAGGTSDSPFLGPLCKWTTDELLCYGTVFPISLWAVGFVVAVVVLCLRTGVANEYERLSEWTDSSLVPNSLKSLGRKRRDRIFAKIRTIPLQKLFRKLTLGEEFVGGCAAVGIATLGDLVFLRPVFLRDLGFGVNEKQQIMRSIEKRAQYVEEVHRIGNNTVELVSPTLATVVEEACASNRDNVMHYALKPHEASLRRHVGQCNGDSAFGAGNGVFSLPSMQSSLAFYPIDQVHSEQVSKLFWDFFRSEFNAKVSQATQPPHISISEGSRRSSRVSKQFYINTRHKWQAARRKLVVLRIAFVSTFRRISVKAAPVEIVVNEQFWLAFVMRWSMQQERMTKMKELDRAKKEARDRLRIQKYETQLEESRQEIQKMVTSKSALRKVGSAMSAAAALVMSPLARLFGDRLPPNAPPPDLIVRDRTEAEEHPDGSPNNSTSNNDDDSSSNLSDDFTMVAYPDESDGVFTKNADDIADDDDEMIMIDDHNEHHDTEMLELDALADEWVAVDALQVEALEERYTVEVSFARVLKDDHSNSDDDCGGVQAEVERAERLKLEAASSPDADLDMLIVYHTSIAMWNEFVHEFQEGEMGVLVGPRRRQSEGQVGSHQEKRTDESQSLEMTAMNKGTYEPPDFICVSQEGLSSQFLVDLHIISNVSTSDRFEEMRRRLLMMRDDTTVDEWRSVQEAQLAKQQSSRGGADDGSSRSPSPSESNASSAFSTPSRSERPDGSREADTVTRKKRGPRGVSFFVSAEQMGSL